MTPLGLQADLAEEIENITRHMSFQDKLGKEVRLKAFKQSLPMLKNDEDVEPFPYVIVRIVDGDMPNNGEMIKIILIIGIYDNDEKAQGHMQILNIMQDIKERFRKNPILSKKYIASEEIKWTLQEEDTYPYFFGGMELNWQTQSIQREGRYT